jgi:polysaccharide biosynthesis/export protein ExoF
MAASDTPIQRQSRNKRHQVTLCKRHVLVGVLFYLCAHQAALASPTASPSTPPPSPPPLTFAVGDKLKVSFYEPFDDEAKWQALGQVREPGPSFYLHDDISGDYTVASDWTISVPIIGNVVVAHRTAAEIEAILGRDFSKAVGHPGFVNISITARRPLYVIGSVNKPGVYQFEPDMTPLNLVALAGGYITTPPQTAGTSVEALQETAKQMAGFDELSHALAQYAVLRAEISNTQAEPSQQLVDLVGRSGADVLVQEEQAKRLSLEQVRATQLKALQIAVDAAQSTLLIDQGRLKPSKDAVGVHLARLSSLSTLSREGLIAQMQLDQGQDTVSEFEERQQNVLSAIADDQRQLALAKVDIAKFVADSQADLSQQLDERQREIDDLTPTVSAGAEVIKLLGLQGVSENNGAVRFSIVRDGQLIAANATTGLQPGDVVQVEMDASKAGALPGESAPSPGVPPPLPQSAW